MKTMLAMIGILTLTACGSKPATDLYVLRADSADSSMCRPTKMIAVARPVAPSQYDTKRMAILLDNNHLTYYSGASWASPLPDQLQAFITDALGQDVESDDNTAAVLKLTLREAHVININAPVVHLRIQGSLYDPVSKRVIQRLNINEKIPAAENHMPQIVDAFNQAASHAAQEIAKAMKLRCTRNR
ncbi:MAG: ABC-type transport auxiliary lipoprotein family protein [Pseudomonadota bacterium]